MVSHSSICVMNERRRALRIFHPNTYICAMAVACWQPKFRSRYEMLNEPYANVKRIHWIPYCLPADLFPESKWRIFRTCSNNSLIFTYGTERVHKSQETRFCAVVPNICGRCARSDPCLIRRTVITFACTGWKNTKNLLRQPDPRLNPIPPEYEFHSDIQLAEDQLLRPLVLSHAVW